MTGSELIAEERFEQLNDHKFSIKKDQRYVNGELKQAAIYALTENPSYYPSGWDTWFMNKLEDKNRYQQHEIEKLKVAGALIAAEIDRLQFSETKEAEQKNTK